MRRTITLILLAVFVAGLVGCELTRAQKGALIGAGAGAAAGGVIGDKAGNTAVGAILGAAIGGAAGAYIGNYMDEQAAEMERDLEGARIERIGEGIKVTFDSGILFDVNKSELKPEAKANLQNLAVILNKYSDTNVRIEGHTDSSGGNEHNMNLSMSRAQSAATYMDGLQVDATRFTILGYGEDQPIADNETASGRQANRRVEIAIMANDKLKKVAEDQAG